MPFINENHFASYKSFCEKEENLKKKSGPPAIVFHLARHVQRPSCREDLQQTGFSTR
jgi:hypothetical protein